MGLIVGISDCAGLFSRFCALFMLDSAFVEYKFCWVYNIIMLFYFTQTNQTRPDGILLTIFSSLFFFILYTLPECRREL